ncbi:hypothetical protein HispidOSU_030882 [Sigmodon hispidus]
MLPTPRGCPQERKRKLSALGMSPDPKCFEHKKVKEAHFGSQPRPHLKVSLRDILSSKI